MFLFIVLVPVSAFGWRDEFSNEGVELAKEATDFVVDEHNPNDFFVARAL